VSTSGWGQDSTPTFSSIWNSTIETQELKRAAESIDADTGIADHTTLSGEATREGAFKTFESESYKSEVTLTTLFPDSQSVSGGVAFDTVRMTNEDSWSFLTIGGGQIQTSAGQDGEVIATGGSSAQATETLTYTATATRNVESIHHHVTSMKPSWMVFLCLQKESPTSIPTCMHFPKDTQPRPPIPMDEPGWSL